VIRASAGCWSGVITAGLQLRYAALSSSHSAGLAHAGFMPAAGHGLWNYVFFCEAIYL